MMIEIVMEMRDSDGDDDRWSRNRHKTNCKDPGKKIFRIILIESYLVLMKLL